MQKVLTIQVIEHGSVLYKQALYFRFKLLRKPLGLEWSANDLEGEDQQIHIAAICNDKVFGTLVLKLISQTKVKLRPMAVDNDLQGSGVGRNLIQFAENLAKTRGFEEMEINAARKSVVGFYEKLGYKTVGEEFESVTLKSINMLKVL